MKNFIFFLVLLFIFSCEQHEWVNPEMPYEGTACGTPNPLEELDWLKTKIEEATNSPSSDYCQVYSVIQGTYQGETVFIPVLSGALCCICGNAVYNCKGEVIFACDLDEENKIDDKKVIWKRG